MIEIVFSKDYATFKKGDIVEIESMLAARLINKHKVADIYEKPKPKAKKKK